MDRLQRLELLFGEQAVSRLRDKTVAVFGLGGVGGIACEALARSGIGKLVLIDGDVVDISNFNRQAAATREELGKPKVEAMTRRLEQAAPGIKLESWQKFYARDDWQPDWSSFDYVVDAIDDVSAKIKLICRCRELGIPVISCMGAGNRLDPMAFAVMDISKTSMDPLARAVRKKLKEVGILSGVKTVCSREKPQESGQRTPGSFMPVVSAAGLLLAAQTVRDLMTQ